MPTGARDIQRDRRDKRRPEAGWIPDTTFSLPIGSNPGGIDFSSPALFAYDAILQSSNLDGTIGLFVASGGSDNAIVFGTGGNLVVQVGGDNIAPISVPTRQIFNGYVDRRVTIAMLFDTTNPNFTFGLWADGDLLVRSTGNGAGGNWGEPGSVVVGSGGMVLPADSVLRYHTRIPEPFGSPKAPRFVQ